MFIERFYFLARKILKINSAIVRVCICEILRYYCNNKQKFELVVKLMKLIVLSEKKMITIRLIIIKNYLIRVETKIKPK